MSIVNKLTLHYKLKIKHTEYEIHIERKNRKIKVLIFDTSKLLSIAGIVVDCGVVNMSHAL